MYQLIKLRLFLIILLSVLYSCGGTSKASLLEVKYKSEGDFGFSECQIEIYSIQSVTFSKVTYGIDSVITVRLPKETDTLISQFMKSLQGASTANYCTTIVSIKCKANKESVNKSNIDCSWRGFDDLRDKILAYSK